MENQHLIKAICENCYHFLKEVDYKSIRPALISEHILTDNHVSDLQNKTGLLQNEELFFNIAPRLGMDKFKKLINVVEARYPLVAEKLIDELNSIDANQNQKESKPSDNLDQSNKFSSVELSRLPESMRDCRLTGTECQEDVQRLLGASQANQLQPCHGTALSQSSGIQPIGQLPEPIGSNDPRSNKPLTITKRLGYLACTTMDTDSRDIVCIINNNEFQRFKNRDGTDMDKDELAQIMFHIFGWHVIFKTDLTSKAYNMETTPRGIVLLINNNKFDHFDNRDGTNKDKDNLTEMFHNLGWKVTSKTDLTAKDMDKYMKKLAQYQRLDRVSALAVVILTHGYCNDILFGKDGRIEPVPGNHQITKYQPVPDTYIDRVQIMQNFSSTNCKLMDGKPKWFIIQACRGLEEDILPATVNPLPGTSNDLGADIPIPNNDITGQGQPRAERQNPNLADMYYVFASSPGHKAYRFEDGSGSPFINTLTNCVKEHARLEDIVGIFNQIRLKLSVEKLGDQRIMLPESSNLLLKDWYFNPPQESKWFNMN